MYKYYIYTFHVEMSEHYENYCEEFILISLQLQTDKFRKISFLLVMEDTTHALQACQRERR